MRIRKTGIAIVVFICFILTSCADGSLENIYKETREIPIENLKKIDKADLPFKFNNYMIISEEQYVFSNIIDNKMHLYLYDERSGLIREGIVNEETGDGEYSGYEQMFYDDKNGVILITIWKPDPVLYIDQENEIIIALDMDFQEQWRIIVPSITTDILVTDDVYFIVSHEGDLPIDVLDLAGIRELSCRVIKLSKKGEILQTYTRENFQLNQVVMHDGQMLLSGTQLKGDRYEAVIMKGDKTDFFSDDFVVMKKQVRISVDYIKEDRAVLTGMNADRSEQYTHLFDISNMRVTKTIDVSKVRSKYNLNWAWSVCYGENDREIAILGITMFGSELHESGIDLLLIPVDVRGKARNVLPLDLGQYPYLFGEGFEQNESFIRMLCYYTSMYDPDIREEAIIKFDINKNQMADFINQL